MVNNMANTRVVLKDERGDKIVLNPTYNVTDEGLFEINGRLYYEDEAAAYSYSKNTDKLELINTGGNGIEVSVVNYGTKAADDLKNRYSSIEGYSIEDVYGRPSDTKKYIDKSLQALCNSMGGHGYGITGHNGFYFSARWYLEAAGADGIMQDWLIVETAGGRKATPLDHDDRTTKRRKGERVYCKKFIDYVEEMNKNKEEMWREINEDLYAEIYPY